MRVLPKREGSQSRTLAILDASVLVRAFLSTDHDRSPAWRRGHQRGLCASVRV